MDNITILDISCMLLNKKEGHQANMDILKSLYERTHSSHLAMLSASLVLLAAVLGGLVASLTKLNQTFSVTLVVIPAAIALTVLLIAIGILSYRLRRLRRDYLDIVLVYNLLSRYF